MTDLIIQGINGRMGHTLVEKISARSDCRIVAGVDQKAGQIGDIPVTLRWKICRRQRES